MIAKAAHGWPGQAPEGTAGISIIGCQDLGPYCLIQRKRIAIDQDMRTKLKYFAWPAFDKGDFITGFSVDRGHPFTASIEWDLVDARSSHSNDPSPICAFMAATFIAASV